VIDGSWAGLEKVFCTLWFDAETSLCAEAFMCNKPMTEFTCNNFVLSHI